MVVAIIGLLAAIAIPSFSRYVKRSRTAEVPEYMAKIIGGATAYYETDHTMPSGTVLERQFPTNTVMESNCCGFPNDRCPGSAPQYQRDEWEALSFTIAVPHLYRPDFFSAGIGTASTFTVQVHGDLDCDTVWSLFLKKGGVSADNSVESMGATHSLNDFE